MDNAVIQVIKDFIATRSDNGKSLPWLESYNKNREDTMIKTIEHISKVLHDIGNRDYGENLVQINNTLIDIVVLNAAASTDKAYVTGFMDALAMIK